MSERTSTIPGDHREPPLRIGNCDIHKLNVDSCTNRHRRGGSPCPPATVITRNRDWQTISGRRFPRSPGHLVFSDDKASQSTTNRRIPVTIETQPWLVRTVPDSATRQISPKSGRVPGYLAGISTEFVSDHYALASEFRQNSAVYLVTWSLATESSTTSCAGSPT